MRRILGNVRKGKVFVVSAPSGTGKTTLVQLLEEEFPSIVRSITCTTREPRFGEVRDVDYHFLSKETFLKRKEAGDFLESAQVFEDYYGTLKQDVEMAQDAGKHVVLVIDTQGAVEIRKKIPAILIFIEPPSLDELGRRLRERKTESGKRIEERLSWAQREIEKGKDFDYYLVNEDLNAAYQVLRSIFIAEEHKVNKCKQLSN